MIDKNKIDFFNGIGTSGSLIISGILILFLFDGKMSGSISSLFVSFGITGFGFEIDKQFKDYGFQNLFLGISIILFFSSILFFYYSTLTKIIFIIAVSLSTMAIISGVMTFFYTKRESNVKNIEFVKEPKINISLILTIIGIVADILSIYSFIKEL